MNSAAFVGLRVLNIGNGESWVMNDKTLINNPAEQ